MTKEKGWWVENDEVRPYKKRDIPSKTYLDRKEYNKLYHENVIRVERGIVKRRKPKRTVEEMRKVHLDKLKRYEDRITINEKELVTKQKFLKLHRDWLEKHSK